MQSNAWCIIQKKWTLNDWTFLSANFNPHPLCWMLLNLFCDFGKYTQPDGCVSILGPNKGREADSIVGEKAELSTMVTTCKHLNSNE